MSDGERTLAAAVRDLRRLSQEIDGRQVMPNRIQVRLPRSDFARLQPILSALTAELGEALVAWARREGHAWYRDLGPFLTVELAPVERLEVRCSFVTEPPVTTGGSPDRTER